VWETSSLSGDRLPAKCVAGSCHKSQANNVRQTAACFRSTLSQQPTKGQNERRRRAEERIWWVVIDG
jgi:hypothetical protein